MEKENASTQYFDRYEMIAVAVPGAALLLTFAYAFPRAMHAPDQFRDLTIGDLGLFLVASLIAGHVVQAFAKIIEDGFDRLYSRTFRSRCGKLPAELLRRVKEQLQSLKEGSQENWPMARREMMIRVRAATDEAKLVDALKVNAGMNRGLFLVALLATVLFGVLRRPLDAGISAVVLFAITKRAIEYSDKFEQEVMAVFISTLTSATTIRRSD